MSVEVDTMFLNCLKGAIQLPDDENMVYFGNVLASNVTDRRWTIKIVFFFLSNKCGASRALLVGKV